MTHRFIPALFLALLTAAPAAEKVKSYDVRGVIRELRPDRKEMVIKHETIPGYMDAMIMPFTVRDARLFEQVLVGDSVAFKLRVTKKEDWMEELKVTSRAKSSKTVPQALPTARLGEILSFKGIKLVDQNGRAFDLEETRGKTLVLTFFFTRCPFPKMCPLLADKFEGVQKQLVAKGKTDTLLLSVTIDPEHDRPAVLHRYASQYKADPSYWRLATGELRSITKLAMLCGVDFWEENGLINHSLLTLVLSPDGKITYSFPNNDWSVDAMLNRL
jgi:protein SCO1